MRDGSYTYVCVTVVVCLCEDHRWTNQTRRKARLGVVFTMLELGFKRHISNI